MKIRGRTIWHLSLLAISIPLIYLLWFRDLRPFRVPTKSMVPTILPGDYLFTMSEDEYRRGDIVVLEDPSVSGGFLAKRIVGLPGDTVSVAGGGLFINGYYASEPYRHEFIDYYLQPYEVKEEEYFVMGDNANWSIDSHNWSGDPNDRSSKHVKGIPRESVIGRVQVIYLPWDRRQRVRHYPLENLKGE